MNSNINKVIPSFLVALPMYNEENNVERCISQIFDVLNKIETRNGILAVNDGSIDRTALILQSLLSDYPRLYVVNHEKNRSYGGAVRSAYKFAIDHHFEYILFMDADLTQDPKYILDFLLKMEEGYDVIKASRYIKGSSVVGVPQYRVTISRFGNLIARYSLRVPITDYTNGFRAIKTSLAERFCLKANTFEVLMEEIFQAKHASASFVEVSYQLTSRLLEEDSKFQYNPIVFYNYLKYCLFSLIGINPELE